GLFSSMINAYIYNSRRKQENINIFEITKITRDLNKYNYVLGALFDETNFDDKITGNKIRNDFVYVKSLICNTLNRLGFSDIDFSYDLSEDFMHPFNKVKLMHKGNLIGYIFQVHPFYLRKEKLNKEIVYVELDLTYIQSNINNKKTFEDFTSKPYVEKDLTMTIDEGRRVNLSLTNLVKDIEEVHSIKFIDIYQDDILRKDGKKSVSLRVKFDNSKNMSSEDIEKTLLLIGKKLYN
ncbi:MAG: hypothetical protein HRS57_02600, partial [Mycoplasmataceae bacterium]|nr:hypothetical protein [Mycoplasmataceae bacterium]